MKQRLRDLAWDGTDLLRAIFDLLRWPFERAFWLLERGVVWPLREGTVELRGPMRTAALAGVGLLLAAGVAFGTVRALDPGEQAPPVVAAPVSAPAPAATPVPSPAEPVLEGATPDFTPESGDASAKLADADTVIAAESTDSEPGAVASTATSSSVDEDRDEIEDPGPAAIDVAREFSNAFVLYETGRSDAEVREAFGATATPQLARALLQRPPRLPANVKVPKAKVLNVVPGPRRGSTYTLSASLLRVGITSELRIDVQRDDKTREWRVTDVLG
jgi:hypothetical protein